MLKSLRARACTDVLASWINNTERFLPSARFFLTQEPSNLVDTYISKFAQEVVADINRRGGLSEPLSYRDFDWNFIEPLILTEEHLTTIPAITTTIKNHVDDLARAIEDKARGMPQDVREAAAKALDLVIEQATKAKEELTKKPVLPLVVYHKNCADGSASAWAMSTFFGLTGAEYMPIAPEEGDKVLEFLLKDRDVYFVDVSATPDILLDIARHCRFLTVIDHHRTAQNALMGAPVNSLPNFTLVMNTDHSGACLTWDYVWRTLRRKAPPQNRLINYVEDRDLWRFDLPGSKEVSAYIAMCGYELSTFSQLDQDFESDFKQVKALGRVLYQFQQQIAKTHAATMHLQNDGSGRQYVRGCASCQISETAAAALAMYPEAEYSCTYFDRHEKDGTVKRVFSLRSRSGTDVDVGEIAVSRGGGGHKHAAGYTVELTHE